MTFCPKTYTREEYIVCKCISFIDGLLLRVYICTHFRSYYVPNMFACISVYIIIYIINISYNRRKNICFIKFLLYKFNRVMIYASYYVNIDIKRYNGQFAV